MWRKKKSIICPEHTCATNRVELILFDTYQMIGETDLIKAKHRSYSIARLSFDYFNRWKKICSWLFIIRNGSIRQVLFISLVDLMNIFRDFPDLIRESNRGTSVIDGDQVFLFDDYLID